ncbi:TonB-dependent receptor [candidate division WOR-3 bacterium]|nr:TonB-dependent receptor [candidate division WOR-3 bacterium]
MRIQGGGLARHIIVGRLFPLIVCLLSIIAIASAENRKTASDPGKMVITDEDIKKMNVHSMVELLNQIPGVSAGETSVNLRGASTRQIRVLLDGRTINDPTSSWRAVNWSIISVSAIEKIEIYKGTGSVLYGDNSSGGVIIITTKKIAKGAHGNIEASYGRFNSQEYDLNFQKDIGNFGLALSSGWKLSDGFRTNSNKDKKRISTKLSYELEEDKDIILSFDYSHLKKGSSGPIYFPTPRAKAEEEHMGFTFLYPLSSLMAETHYTDFKKGYKNPDSGLDNIMESWILNEKLSSPVSIGRLGQFNIGTDLEIAHVEGNKIASHQEEKYAVYATRDIHFQSFPVNFGLGVRANFYSDFSATINPQLQLTYGWHDFDIQFSVNRSNNIPTFHHRYYESSNTKPNPDLKMEETTNYNLTFSSQFKELAEGSLSFFLNDMSNRITYTHEDTFGTYINVGSAVRKGIEATIKWTPDNIWQVKTSYTFLIARDEDTGKYLTYSPKHQLSFDLQLRPFRKLSLGLNTKYISKEFVNTDNTKSLQGHYFRSDLRGDYYLKEKVNLFFKIDNLFNRDYDNRSYGYPVTPRALKVGIGYEF